MSLCKVAALLMTSLPMNHAPCAVGQSGAPEYVQSDQVPMIMSVTAIGSDGRSRHDLAVGIPSLSMANGESGVVVILAAESGLLLGRILAPPETQGFGSNVQAISDLDGDGRGELLVACLNGRAPFLSSDPVVTGQREYEKSTLRNGVVLIVSPGTGKVVRTHNGSVPRERFGERISALRDIDGDGITEYAISAPGDRRASPGCVVVYSGKDGTQLYRLTALGSSTATETIKIQDGKTGELFGMSVASIGDVDGDSCPDIAVGAPLRCRGDLRVGGVDVFSGKTGARLWSIDGTEDNEQFGCSVVGGRDLNGDDVDDFVVGSLHRSVQAYSGKNRQVLCRASAKRRDGFGHSIGLLDDLDGDGVVDMVVGRCEGYPDDDDYAVAIISGKTGVGIAEVGDNFGQSIVTVVGDVNGDMVSDYCVLHPLSCHVVLRSGKDSRSISEWDRAMLAGR